jgi:hypothetical protein
LQTAQNHTKYSALRDSVVTEIKSTKSTNQSYNPADYYSKRSLGNAKNVNGTITGGWNVEFKNTSISAATKEDKL